MTHRNDAHDFEQFSGKFDQAVAPSPSFAASLRARTLDAPASNVSPQPIVTATPSVITNDIADNPPTDDAWRAPGWMRTVEAAVAALIVLSLLAASAYFRQPEALFELAFQPTPEPEQTAINFGGDPGRTWVLGDVEPVFGGFRVDPSIPMEASQSQFSNSQLIIEDSFVFTLAGEEDELVRYDLDTHERAWAIPMYVSGNLASDGDYIFGMRSDRMATTDSATLVAIDFETGETAWEGPELAHRFVASSTLVVSGDSIFATDYLGNLVAVDTNDGSLLWQFPETFAVPPDDEDSISGPSFYAAPEIAVNDDTVFFNRPSQDVFKLNRETGELVDSINLVGDYGSDIFTSTIQVRDNRLVVTALHALRTSGEDDIRGYYPTTLLIFDAQSLEPQTQTELLDYRGNAVITDDAIYLPVNTEEDGEARLYRLDPGTGKLSDPIEGVSATWDMLLSASGNVLMATSDPSTIAFFELDTGEPINQVELGITNMETPFGSPIRLWENNPIVITALGEVYVVTDETDEQDVAAEVEINHAGDAGRSWVLGDDMPTAGSAGLHTDLPPAGSSLLGSPLIIGDSIIYSGAIFSGSQDVVRPILSRFDLVSNELVWESDVEMYGAMASDGRLVYGFVPREGRPVPVAVSLETGELTWEAPALMIGSDGVGSGPILKGDVVYYFDSLGNTVALKASDGSQIWQYPESFLKPTEFGDVDETIGNPPNADVVVTDAGVFVELPSLTIVKLDPATGKELDSFNVVDQYGTDIVSVWLQATSDRLVVIAQHTEKRQTGPHDGPPHRPVSILVFDTETLDLVSRTGIPELDSNLVVTAEALYFAGRQDLSREVQLFHFDLDSGERSGDHEHPLPDFNPGDRLSLSVSGTTLMTTDGSTYQFFDLSTETTLGAGSFPGLAGESIAGSPIQMWGETPIVIGRLGEIIVFTGDQATPAP